MVESFAPVDALEGLAGQQEGQVSEHLQKAIRELALQYENQCDVSRREYVRRCLKLHEFFRGNQYLWWDPRIGAYRAPTQTGGLMAGAGQQTVQNSYTINVFQGFLMANLAILSANHPTQRFSPMDASSAQDVEVAKKADEYIKIFERRSKVSDRLQEQIYLLWCDGTIGSYIHNEVNGDKYGYTEEPIYETVTETVGYETYQCLACGNAAGENMGGMCPMCQAPYTDASIIPAPEITRQKQVGVKRIPRSKVVWDVVGGLELKLPPMAKDQSEFPFLIRSREVNKALVRAAYPDLADKINGSDSSTGSAGSLERRARRQLSQGVTTEQRAVISNTGEDVTFKEIWFRPWAFFQLDDKELRAELLEKYPDGVYVAFADETFLEARPERLDDHWRICHALPGRGQVREPIGGALVQIQEIVNDLYNIVRDVVEFTLPATFVDNEVLDVDKWSRSNVMAGASYSVRAKPGRSVADAFFQTQAGQLPQYTTTLMQELRTDVPQFILGTFPAAFGGGTPGNPTAAGQAIERDAAMGRLGLFWRTIKEHYADVAPLIVQTFATNGLEPEVMTETTEGGSFINLAVDPDDFKKGNLQAYCEVIEDYPTTWPQRQGMLTSLMGNPMFQGGLAKLKNLAEVKQTLGVTIEMPGEKAYSNAWKTIERLISEQPVPQTDEMTGQQMGMTASVQPGPLDDFQSVLEACKDFDQTARAQMLRDEKSPGYDNFLLYAAELMKQMAPPMPPEAGPEGGAPPATDTGTPPPENPNGPVQ